MRLPSLLAVSLLASGACNGQLEQAILDGENGRKDMAGDAGAFKDMDLPPACTAPAAMGLSGTPLPGTCVNFGDFADGDPAASLPGWNFASVSKPNCQGWTVANGKLQVKSYATIVGSCGFTMPLFVPADYTNYKSLTLSIIHTPDVTAASQDATISMAKIPTAVQVWAITGRAPRQTTIVKIDKTAFPTMGYQPEFVFNSPTDPGGATGWKIESIVVMGNP